MIIEVLKYFFYYWDFYLCFHDNFEKIKSNIQKNESMESDRLKSYIVYNFLKSYEYILNRKTCFLGYYLLLFIFINLVLKKLNSIPLL